jgi:hypothetical protein
MMRTTVNAMLPKNALNVSTGCLDPVAAELFFLCSCSRF